MREYALSQTHGLSRLDSPSPDRNSSLKRGWTNSTLACPADPADGGAVGIPVVTGGADVVDVVVVPCLSDRTLR